MTKSKIHEYLMTLLIVVCIVIATVVCGLNIMIPTAYADSEDCIQTRYEQTNVMNNLKGSTIGGKAFDIKDYPHNANAKPQIISFVEFCYSYYAEKQDDYALYILLYNPQDTAIDINTTRNKIQFTYGNKPSYAKYALKFLNYSNEAGIEGRFYKFKIELTEAERVDILKTLSPDERVYKVSGIELSVKNKVTEHTTAQTYTYKGFAVGYGSELAETDTLSCKVDGFDKYISLDVRSTYWRPKGTHVGDLTDLITRDTLHSVYFSVPNKIINDYGEMTAVHATWLNAYTNPIFVTGNKTIYDAVYKKRQRKSDEKQKQCEDKLKRKEQERKSKRTWKLRDQERKRQEKQRKKEDKFYKKQYSKVQRKRQKQLKNKDPKKLTLADLDNLSDDILAELYYEEYGDEEFGEPYDFNDELPFK